MIFRRCHQKDLALIVGATVLAVPMAADEPAHGWIATCSQPSGPLIEFGNMVGMDGKSMRSPEDGFVEARDSFTHVLPVFVYRGGGAGDVSVIWGNTRPEGIPAEIISQVPAKTEPVISEGGGTVATLGLYGAETWLTTFWPALGVVFATRHNNVDFAELGTIASVSTFAMRCEFRPL